MFGIKRLKMRKFSLRKIASLFFVFAFVFMSGFANAAENRILTQASLEKPLVQHYIRMYSSPDWRPGLLASMERAAPFLSFIDREIAERGLPWELRYLPLIESNFQSTALSRSGASGLWQFMENSIAPFDMRIDNWMDERRDFWKSTQGALRKLKENYDIFEDWPLALAAYNMGTGGINRVITQSGIRDYWTLAERGLLRYETVRYVPRLIAAAYVLSNTEYYGIELRPVQDPLWIRVPIARSIDLRLLADQAGMDRETLLMANQELHHYVTPPARNHQIKVPARYAERIAAVLNRGDIVLLEYHYHLISSGDTLHALARHYGVTVEQIIDSNPGIQARYLRIGNRLMIPAVREIEPFLITRRNLGIFTGEHRVQRGETLWSISRTYGIDPETLAEANQMGINDILREGIILKTPIR